MPVLALNSETKLRVIERRKCPRIEWNRVRLCLLVTCIVFLLVPVGLQSTEKDFQRHWRLGILQELHRFRSSFLKATRSLEQRQYVHLKFIVRRLIARISLTRYDSLFRMNLGHRFFLALGLQPKTRRPEFLRFPESYSLLLCHERDRLKGQG